MSALTDFSSIARSALVAAAIAIVLFFIKFGAAIIAPILLAVFISVLATPALRWMRRFGIPRWGALAIIFFVLLDIGGLFAVVIAGGFEAIKDGLPGYQERFVLLSREVGEWLEEVGIPGSHDAITEIFNLSRAMGLLRAFVSNAGGIFATGLLVLLAVFFMLLEAPSLEAKLKRAFNLTEEADERLRQVVTAINHYMLIKTLTSSGTGLCVGVWLWSMSIEFALLWSLFAFLLNFVPYVGAVLMTIPPVLLALVQYDIQTALLVGTGIILINGFIGSLLEPRLMGQGLGISTLAVFLSLVFWGWLLGATGVFLAVPLTIALMMALDASPVTRPIAILLGPETTKETTPKEEVPPGVG